MSESLIIEHQLLLCHYCDVVLPVKVLLLFVEVDQFLVQWLNEQLNILRTSVDIAVFPEPILSSADGVQHFLDFVVARRLPRVVLGQLNTCSSRLHTSDVTSVTEVSR